MISGSSTSKSRSWLVVAYAESLVDPLANAFTFKISIVLSILFLLFGFFSLGIQSSFLYAFFQHQRMDLHHLLFSISVFGFGAFLSLPFNHLLTKNYNPGIATLNSQPPSFWMNGDCFWTYRKVFILALFTYNISNFALMFSSSFPEFLLFLAMFGFYLGTVVANTMPYIYGMAESGYLEDVQIEDDQNAVSGERTVFLMRKFGLSYGEGIHAMLPWIVITSVLLGNMMSLGMGMLSPSESGDPRDKIYPMLLYHSLITLCATCLAVLIMHNPAVSKPFSDQTIHEFEEMRKGSEEEEKGDIVKERTCDEYDCSRLSLTRGKSAVEVIGSSFLTSFFLVEITTIGSCVRKWRLDFEELLVLEFGFNLITFIIMIYISLFPRFQLSAPNGITTALLVFLCGILVLFNLNTLQFPDSEKRILFGLCIVRFSIALFITSFNRIKFQSDQQQKCTSKSTTAREHLNKIQTLLPSKVSLVCLYAGITIKPLIGSWACEGFGRIDSHDKCVCYNYVIVLIVIEMCAMMVAVSYVTRFHLT